MNKPTEQETIDYFYWTISEVMVAMQRLKFLYPEKYALLAHSYFTLEPANHESWFELRNFIDRALNQQ